MGNVRSLKTARKVRAKQKVAAKPKTRKQGLNRSQARDHIGDPNAYSGLKDMRGERDREEALQKYRAALLHATQQIMSEQQEEIQRRALALLDGGWAPPHPQMSR